MIQQGPFVQPIDPSPTCVRYSRRATRPSSRRAACQHQRSARCAATSARVGLMAHLPLCIGSLPIEEHGPSIKPCAYIRISVQAFNGD
jgi:hypothetical protein